MRSWAGLAVTVHDAAAALLSEDGSLRAAAEERFAGRKRCGGWPRQALAWLSQSAPEPRRIALSWRPWAGLARRVLGGGPALRTPRARLLMAQAVAPLRLGRPVLWLPHHLCHAAAAFWTSPWQRAAILVVDAAGEGWTTWAGRGEGWRLELLARTPFPHSLGFLYAGVTEHLGFAPDLEEGTVMGLAALGRPGEALRRAVSGLARTDGLEVRLDLAAFAHHRRLRPILSREGASRLGPPRGPGDPLEQRHADLAAALQRRTEEVLVALARTLHRTTGLRALCLGGGVALNAPAVERIRRESGFASVHVPPFPHDAGTAVGAALLLSAAEGGVDREALRASLSFPGPRITREDARRALRDAGLHWSEPRDPEAEVAVALARGLVVARARGRAELGPRALGHRSLLCDPRHPHLRDRLNRMKGRQPFRPVAPVMTAAEARRFLDTGQMIRFMERAVPVRPEARAAIPAVVHADGTARAQTVTREDHPDLHRLLQSFGRHTGIEVLGNTSFNLPGRPMVTGPREAVRTAMELGVDLLDLAGLLVVLRIPE